MARGEAPPKCNDLEALVEELAVSVSGLAEVRKEVKHQTEAWVVEVVVAVTPGAARQRCEHRRGRSVR
jgi:hypothetical protein